MTMRATPLAPVLALAALLASPSASAQSELQSRHFTTSDGVELHYLEAGAGPPLVFVPGWTMPAWIWEPQIEHFGSDYRVVALDPRGQGESQKPSYGYQPTRRAADICELLDHLGGEPAVVAGWSLAVQEVLVCAHEFGTERIRAAVLVDYPIRWNTQGLTSRFTSLQVEREDWTWQFVEAIHQSEPSEEYLEDLTRAALATPTTAAAMIANLILMGPTDLRPMLESVDRPVLHVATQKAPDWDQAIRQHRSESRVEVIDGTAHALFRDKPEDFNRVLEEFRATLPEE